VKGETMKRAWLTIWIVGLVAGQAAGSMYVLDAATALKFTHYSVSSGDAGQVLLVTTNLAAYNPPAPYVMEGAVGYVGYLWPNSLQGHTYAVITISADGTGGVSGTYTDGYGALLANDDDEVWDVRLFVTTTDDNTVYSDGGSFTTLASHSALTWFAVPGPLDFSQVKDFGFEIGTERFDGFHISAVPVPGAALLGALGLLTAGARLRRSRKKEAPCQA